MQPTEVNTSPEARDSATEHCANCATPLLGPHCHACGQPVRGMVRHFSSILGDLFDTLLALDSRIARTLWPLLTNPGFLTREYLAGRRVRYVSPVRLFIFLCLTTFFLARFTGDWSGTEIQDVVTVSGIETATTVEEVERVRAEALAGVAQAQRDVGNLPGMAEGMTGTAQLINREADLRIAELTGASAPAALAEEEDECLLNLGADCWDPQHQPLQLDMLPQFLNDWLNTQALQAQHNIRIIKDDPGKLVDKFLGVLPSTLFILLPVFSLMLWLSYLLQRRFYMEHLIVALHSHAFLCAALLLMVLLTALHGWLGEVGVVDVIYGWSCTLLLLWMPVYLLIMQKRVYGQGWPMTLVKFFTLGFLYSLLLGFGAVATLLMSIAQL